MRLRFYVLATAVALLGFDPTPALANPKVEVTTTPLEVEVVNPPPASMRT